jgi:glycosyltransferase involved in cell wall biosynthesis
VTSAAKQNILAIDARWLMTGIGRYTLNLLRHLRPITDDFYLRALTYSQNADTVAPYSDEVCVVSSAIYTLREQWEIPFAAASRGLLHVPHYNAPLLHRGPLVVTIADVTHLVDAHHKRKLMKRLYAEVMLRSVSARADHIFTVSEYSKGRICECLGVKPEKISVVYNGVGSEFRIAEQSSAPAMGEKISRIDGPYLLYVGNLKDHKNVGGLLRAFALLRGRNVDLKLVMIGGDGRGYQQVQETIANLGLSAHVLLRWSVPESELIEAYRGATMLVLPSFEEGFGLPVLEAMACGTPVACSATASLPEIGGDAVAYFDPHDVESIAESMARVFYSADLQQTLRTNGLLRAQQFSWQQSARQHCAVYRRFFN